MASPLGQAGRRVFNCGGSLLTKQVSKKSLSPLATDTRANISAFVMKRLEKNNSVQESVVLCSVGSRSLLVDKAKELGKAKNLSKESALLAAAKILEAEDSRLCKIIELLEGQKAIFLSDGLFVVSRSELEFLQTAGISKEEISQINKSVELTAKIKTALKIIRSLNNNPAADLPPVKLRMFGGSIFIVTAAELKALQQVLSVKRILETAVSAERSIQVKFIIEKLRANAQK